LNACPENGKIVKNVESTEVAFSLSAFDICNTDVTAISN